MTRAHEQEIALRLLSDGKLYADAVAFIHDKGTTTNSQIAGLENLAGAADGLTAIIGFCNHQADKERKRGHDPVFYNGLKQYLENVRLELKTNREFVPADLSKRQLREHLEAYGLLFAREFIHHVAAEHRYRSEGR